MASCSRMPGQPEPSTTGMLPAGDGTADMLTAAVAHGLGRNLERPAVRRQQACSRRARRRPRSPARGGRPSP